MKIDNEDISSFIRYYLEKHEEEKKEFRPGIDEIPVSGVRISSKNIADVIDTVLSGWFTEGERCEQFSKEIGKYFNKSPTLVTLCNSGSSASLLALTALKEFHPAGKRKTVLTCSTGFPTTVAPILQLGYDIHFIDVDPMTLNIDIDQLLEHIYQFGYDCAGVITAHTLGFPFDAEEVTKACESQGMFFIEDCCDAIGASIKGENVGSFGDIATLSFFPAHHITTGEGGAVVCGNGRLHKIIQSYSNWGRDCWCKPGQNNTCNKRFDWQLGHLPYGYDHKYTFSRLGYNLKMTEMQAALGLSQIENLQWIIERRLYNHWYLRYGPSMDRHLEHLRYISYPEQAIPSPFGFPITVISEKFTARDLIRHLEMWKIRTRPIFAGNLARQPMMEGYGGRISGYTAQSDFVMNNSFWVGCHPGLELVHLDFILEKIEEFIEK